MAKKWKTASFGTVSQATMRKEDLIPAFCWELRYLGHRDTELTRIERQIAKVDTDIYYQSEESDFDLEFLFDALGEHAPAYAYFGSSAGDGSDYGFWLDESLEYDFDGLKVEDLAEVPDGYMGEVLVVNDYGNMSLYEKTARKIKEVWALV